MTRERCTDEAGAITIMLALLLPVLILFASFAVDAANLWVHKRHLQTQADAAALAGAGVIGPVGCDNGVVAAEVTAYSGATHNAQIGGTPAERVHMRLNEQTFFGQSKVDADVTGSPCDTMMVDVKMTETDVPWFFRAVAPTPFINAHARVEVRSLDQRSGVMPIGVPEVNPKRVAVQFVDEVTGANIGAPRPLIKRPGTANGLVLWDNAAANGGSPFPITVDSSRLGARVIVSGTDSLTCGTASVECYDAGSTAGALFVRGWSAAPTVSTGSTSTDPPGARSVFLGAGTCPDPYFIVVTADCAVAVRAKVDFNLTEAQLQGTWNQRLGRLTATAGGKDYQLTYNPGTKLFESGAVIPVAAGAGPVPVGLQWEQRSGKVRLPDATSDSTCVTQNSNPCKGTFSGPVQRAFSGSPSRTGPVQTVLISDQDGTGANSVQRCSTSPSYTGCERQFTVQVGIQAPLALSAAGSPPTVLRVGSESGSQNQGLDCDPAGGVGFVEELAYGCGPQYKINGGTPCPGSPNELWGSPQPWPCVAVETGDRTNQVGAGMNLRILGSTKPTTCTNPNRWPDFEKDDPRIVPVFLVPFGAFSGSGQTTIPVLNFAHFYVTGWVGGGGGFKNPCQGQGDDPVPGNDRAALAGHFIKYIDTSKGDGVGSAQCDLSAITGCAAVLTR